MKLTREKIFLLYTKETGKQPFIQPPTSADDKNYTKEFVDWCIEKLIISADFVSDF